MPKLGSHSYATHLLSVADWMETLDERFYNHRGLPAIIRSHAKYDDEGAPFFCANYHDIYGVICDVLVFGRSLGWIAREKQQWLDILDYEAPEYIHVSDILYFLTVKS